MITITTILLFFLALIVILGIIRVIISPYNGFWNLLMEMVFLDFLFDLLSWIFDGISSMWGDDD
jgi:hypothetical protein